MLASCMLLSPAGPAFAQDTTATTNSFSLPGVTLPSGTDEVRAADGTSCRSAISHGGAYLDVGVIGNPNALTGSNTGSESASAYGRLVIPLGRTRKRVDCTRLYDIEVRRLEMELRLMEMGLGRPVENAAADTSATSEDDFSDDGWSTDGLDEN